MNAFGPMEDKVKWWRRVFRPRRAVDSSRLSLRQSMALASPDMGRPMLFLRKAAEVFTSLGPCADPELVPVLVAPVHLVNDLCNGDVGKTFSAGAFKDRIEGAEAIASHVDPPMGSLMTKTIAEKETNVLSF